MLLETIRKKAQEAPQKMIADCQARFCEKLDVLSHALASDSATRPVFLLSGPSGSGKTTTAHMLKSRLTDMGLITHIISMDNYFRTFTPEEKQLFLRHELDLESPERVDGDLLSTQIRDILDGKSVNIPRYDFVTNESHMSGETLRLCKGEIIIFEGIHALNPQVISSADDYTSRIYVSVRTRIEHPVAGERFLLHPSKIRLARRMIRDRRERARSFSDVISLYDSVERGENLYIMPYKYRADYDVDTFIPYEACVYKSLLPTSMPEEQQKHPWLTELFEVLDGLPPIAPDLVPRDALIREFIGN